MDDEEHNNFGSIVPDNDQNISNEEPIQSLQTNISKEDVNLPLSSFVNVPVEQTVMEQPVMQQNAIPYMNDKNRLKQQEREVKRQAKMNNKKSYTGVVIALICFLILLSVVASIAALTLLPSPKDSYLKTIVDKIILSNKDTNTNKDPASSQLITITNDTESAVVAVYKKGSPSVVGIRVTIPADSATAEEPQISGEGSGIIYSADGYIITNNHVIDKAILAGKQANGSKIEVFINSDIKTPYLAEVIGFDSITDLAILKLNNVSNLIPIEFADSEQIQIGEMAIAIGSPGGLEFLNSVSEGIISGINRVVIADNGSEQKWLQTDTAINPGNSGGALLDKTGKLIGINVVKIVAAEYEGMGFAIPSNTVKEITDIIIAEGKVPRPTIGVYIDQNYDDVFATEYGLPLGVRVSELIPNGAAEAAGIVVKDIIIKFGDVETPNFTILKGEINKFKPGDTVAVTIYRSSTKETLTISIVLKN